jgi:hypothetical protein
VWGNNKIDIPSSSSTLSRIDNLAGSIEEGGRCSHGVMHLVQSIDVLGFISEYCGFGGAYTLRLADCNQQRQANSRRVAAIAAHQQLVLAVVMVR